MPTTKPVLSVTLVIDTSLTATSLAAIKFQVAAFAIAVFRNGKDFGIIAFHCIHSYDHITSTQVNTMHAVSSTSHARTSFSLKRIAKP
jgi:hypothetical protein